MDCRPAGLYGEPCRVIGCDPRLEPPIKWAGGKRWLTPVLQEKYSRHRHRRLVEPFVGGMAVAFALRPQRALLADRNEHLINFWREVQKGLVIEMPMEYDRDLYYRHRARFNELISRGEAHGREAASLFYYLNRTGYNGLCRFNSKGLFNVPFGRYETVTYRRDFREYVPVLRSWQLMVGDFEDLPVEADDFIYADPPYDVEFTRYAKDDFRWEDQERLAKWLAAHPGPVVASNQATPRVLSLYRGLGFSVQTSPAPRRISCTGDRRPAEEMVATRNVD